MENKTLKIVIGIFAGLVGFGLGLIAVSLFMGAVDIKMLTAVSGMNTMSGSLGLFDADWDMIDTSPVFMILSFLVLIVGLIMMVVDVALKEKSKKNVKGLNFIALAVSLVGFVLLIVSAITTKSGVEKDFSKMLLALIKASTDVEYPDSYWELAIKMVVSFKLGSGAIMAIVGGVFALIGCIMLVIPKFNPIKLSAATTAAPAPASEPAFQPFAPVPDQFATATEEQPAADAEPAATESTEANNNDVVSE